VYVTRGLLALANSEDELAGVVGHEIGHVAARHAVQRVSRQGPFAIITGVAAGLTGLVSPLAGNIIGGIGGFAQSLVFAPYSRSQETEADTLGQEMAAKAGWDPTGLPAYLETLGREIEFLQDGPRRASFFDSHPPTPDRVARTTKHAKELQQAAREPISPSHEAFLARLDGLVVGQRAANGIIHERRFQHPDRNFFVEFPEKWQIQNTPKRVAAVAPDGGAAVVLGAVAEGTDPLDGARAIEAASKNSVVAHAKPTRIGNLPAAHALLEADKNVMIDVTWIAHAGLVYQIAGLAPRRGFETLRPTFDSVAQSFRPLSPQERGAIRERRIRLVKAREGERLESLIARSHSSWKEKQTAIANGLVGAETLKEGQVIKVVVAEPYVPKNR
jgi:predicted Zn-dependent protease